MGKSKLIGTRGEEDMEYKELSWGKPIKTLETLKIKGDQKIILKWPLKEDKERPSFMYYLCNISLKTTGTAVEERLYLVWVHAYPVRHLASAAVDVVKKCVGTRREHGSKLSLYSHLQSLQDVCIWFLLESLQHWAYQSQATRLHCRDRVPPALKTSKPVSPKPDGYLHLKFKKSLSLRFFPSKGKAWMWLQLASLQFSCLCLREIQKPQKM